MDNEIMIQYFEWDLPPDSILWRRLAVKAGELAADGITRIWLPPAYKGIFGCSDAGYAVYDTYDLGEFDQKGSIPTKYGTKAEYVAAVNALHKHGIKVYADIVQNHKMGADETEDVLAVEMDDSNRNEVVSSPEMIRAETKFTFPGRKGKYSKFEWNHTHFKGVDWDVDKQKKAIYLFEGKEWAKDTDKEKGNFDYLMGADVDFDNPEVQKEVLAWGLWYEKTIHMDGFRLDALKHIESDFYYEWIAKMREQSGKELPCVGEYWSGDLGHLIDYLQRVNYDMSLFDVPLHYNFYNASNSDGHFDMRGILANTLVGYKPENAVTFVDNHDTQPGQSLYSYVNRWFRPIAYALILLRSEGMPCVFYGDYVGLKKAGLPALPELKMLMMIRKKYAYGEEQMYLEQENVVGFVRRGDKEHEHSGLACIISDGAGGTQDMRMGREFAGARMKDALGRCLETITLDPDGNAVFRVDGGSVSVWVFEEAYEYLAINI